MTSRRALVGFAVASLAVASGCAPKPESRIGHDVQIVKEENTPDKLFERGKAFHSVGDLTRAEQYYVAAMQQGAPEQKVLPLLMRVCIDSSRYQVAIEYALPVLKKHPQDFRLRLLVASLYSAIGQPAVAREHYEKVIEQSPDDAMAHYALAVILRDDFKDRAGADKHFREYLRVAPEGPHAEEAKGSLLKSVEPMATAGPSSQEASGKPTPLVTPPAPPTKIDPPKPLTKP